MSISYPTADPHHQSLRHPSRHCSLTRIPPPTNLSRRLHVVTSARNRHPTNRPDVPCPAPQGESEPSRPSPWTTHLVCLHLSRPFFFPFSELRSHVAHMLWLHFLYDTAQSFSYQSPFPLMPRFSLPPFLCQYVSFPPPHLRSQYPFLTILDATAPPSSGPNSSPFQPTPGLLQKEFTTANRSPPPRESTNDGIPAP